MNSDNKNSFINQEHNNVNKSDFIKNKKRKQKMWGQMGTRGDKKQPKNHENICLFSTMGTNPHKAHNHGICEGFYSQRKTEAGDKRGQSGDKIKKSGNP